MFTDVNSSIFIQNFRTLINYLIESNKIAYENNRSSDELEKLPNLARRSLVLVNMFIDG